METRFSVSLVNNRVINISVCISWQWCHHFLATFQKSNYQVKGVGCFKLFWSLYCQPAVRKAVPGSNPTSGVCSSGLWVFFLMYWVVFMPFNWSFPAWVLPLKWCLKGAFWPSRLCKYSVLFSSSIFMDSFFFVFKYLAYLKLILVFGWGGHLTFFFFKAIFPNSTYWKICPFHTEF